jgi:hypothetical protein
VRERAADSKIKMEWIGTDQHVADTLTKALSREVFIRHRNSMLGVRNRPAALMIDTEWAKIQNAGPSDEVKAKLYQYEQVRPLELQEAVKRYHASLLPDYRKKTLCVGGRVIRIPKTRQELMIERKKQNLDKGLKRTRLYRRSWAPRAGNYEHQMNWRKTMQNSNQPKETRNWDELRK